MSEARFAFMTCRVAGDVGGGLISRADKMRQIYRKRSLLQTTVFSGSDAVFES